MSGKTLVWLVMLGGLASAWYAATHPEAIRSSRDWVQAKITGTDPRYSEHQLEQDVVDRINYIRRNAKMPTIAVDSDLQRWLRVSSAKVDADNLDDAVSLVQQEMPRYFEVNVSAARCARLQDLAEKFDVIGGKSEATSRHMAVLSRPVRQGYGFEAILIIGQRLENLTPEGVSARTSDTFFSQCPHCKHPHACKVSAAMRGINLDCPNCGLDYGVLAPDEDGHFRFANEYLTGFQPPARYAEDASKLHEMFTIWNAVIASCRYSKDSTKGAPNRDCWQTAVETLVRGKGDCEDSAILLADWLISRGFDARVALGRYGDIGQHAWCVVRLDNVEYLLESTEGAPKNDKLPFVHEVGARYVPETLFDRDNIYVRSKPHDRFDGSYWATKNWIKVHPRQLFDKPPKSPLLASDTASQSGRGTPSATRQITPGTRTNLNSVQGGFTMPPLTRLRDVPMSSERWQVGVPASK